MKFSLITSADILTSMEKSKLDMYKTLSETLQVDMLSLIEADMSSRITDEDYKKWIVQVTMELPSVFTSRTKFCDVLCDVLENDPAGKVNMGDDEQVDKVLNLAWKKYQVIMAEIENSYEEEEQEIKRFVAGERPSGEELFGPMGEQGEPAASSARGRSSYEDQNVDFDDNDDYNPTSKIESENDKLAELIRSTKELLDSCKARRNEVIRPKPANQSAPAVEDEESSEYTSKRAELMKKYNTANAEAQEAARQAKIKAAQAKQLDTALTALDKEIIKQGEIDFKK